MGNLGTCPVCGGRLNIKIGSAYAACSSCGNLTELDQNDVEKFRGIFDHAKNSVSLNTIAGYKDAIRELDQISFIEEAREKSAEYKKAIEDIQSDQLRKEVLEKSSGKKQTILGMVLLIFMIILSLAAIAGIVYLVILWSKGQLPQGTVIAVLIFIGVWALISIMNSFREK